MTKPSGGWQGKPGTRQARGYGREWDKLRAATLTRDSHLCQPCIKDGRVTPARQVDHIKPKAQGGTDDLGNLQSICVPCHAAKTTLEGHEASGHKPRLGFDADGWPIW